MSEKRRSGPPAAEAGGILTIDLAALEANWRDARPPRHAGRMRRRGQGQRLWLRHRAGRHRLAKAGCKTFFVADLVEARRVRTAAPSAAIYVLNGLMPGTGPEPIPTSKRGR